MGTLRSIGLSLKLHRFEYGVALLMAFGLAVWAWSIVFRSDLSAVSASCLADWRKLGPGADASCTRAMNAWSGPVVNESPVLTAALAYLPFAAGLLAGAPIVAREIETGTARTAWSLYTRRSRWLAWAAAPVLAGLLALMAAVGLGSVLLEADRVAWGYSDVEDLGRYGFVLVVDAAFGFAVALADGALLGRSLPALVFATVIVVALVGASGQLHDAWQRSLEPTVVSEGSGPAARDLSPGAILTQPAWRAPDGRQVAPSVALEAAHAAGVPRPAPGDDADSAGLAWLEANGYTALGLGITRETALSWQWIESAGMGVAALLFAGIAMFAVVRRRPT